MTSVQLWQAASEGHNDIVVALLKQNVPIDDTDGHGWTALHFAARNGHNAVVRTLLEAKATMNAKTDHSATALYIAAQRGHNDVVKTLLGAEAAVDATGTYGTLPLHAAISQGHNKVIQTLLCHNDYASVDTKTAYDRTPLHIACFHGKVDCVLTLLAAGADVHAKRDDGKTACHDAAASRNATTIVPLLVAFGADLDTLNQAGKSARQIVAERGVPVDWSEIALQSARRSVAKVRLGLVRERALQVCIGLQSRGLDALQMCEILQFACGSPASLIPFHHWWTIATTVKHFHQT